MKFKIWNIGFDVINVDDYIESYIKNRFVGFISEFEKNDYLIKKASCNLKKYIAKSYGIIFDMNDKEINEYEDEDIYVVYISQTALLIFEKCKKTIQYQIYDKSNQKIYGYVSVKICEFVMNALYMNEIFCLHCSVVTINNDTNNGIAFIGESGTGKTSLSLKFVEMGEKITNDDIAYVKLLPDGVRAIKNTQYIGVDDNNLKKNFNYLKKSIVKKDELEFDKNRINLFENKKQCYVDYINIKNIVFINKERGLKVALKEISNLSATMKLIKSSMQFSAGKMKKNYMDALISMGSILKTYSLCPSNSLNETAIYLKSFFNNIT